jgi:hypothetical protein
MRSLAGGAVLAVGTLALMATSAGALGAAVLKATPNTALTNHQVIVVSGTGLPKKADLYLAECHAGATGPTGCDLTTDVVVTTSAKGVLAKTNFTVVTGAVGNGKCGTDTKNQRGCFIVIGTGTGTAYAAADISFAK